MSAKRAELDKAYQKVESLASEDEKAKVLAIEVSNAMLEIRRHSDELEALVADDAWPLPKYREMLFLASI